MTWEIVLGIIALTGFVGTFIGATVKMTSTFYTLDITLKDLMETNLELRELKANVIAEEIMNEYEKRTYY